MRLDSTSIHNGTLSVWTALVTDTLDLFDTTSIASIPMSISGGWNLLSIPVGLDHYSADSLFPQSLSPGYGYYDHYVAEDSLFPGGGYWVKFAASENDTLVGKKLFSDTITVHPRWNLIGSISLPVAVTDIAGNPPGIVTGNFYGYEGGTYNVADTIFPGRAYWVKTATAGELILNPFQPPLASRITIVRSPETPPLPPEFSGEESFPGSYALFQNYPNPFNGTTIIRYELPGESHVELAVYNLIGQKVKTLVDGLQGKGLKSATFDASALPGGMYYYRLSAGAFTGSRTMLLIK
jgi:hypothetical protein